jgi:hypothetical protein
MSHLALVLAQEATPKGLWYPTILGVLVVIAAVGLFCGSIYLLLATNFGARLGFLVAFTGLAGFITLLSLLWWTSATPLNVPKGRVAQWVVVDQVTDLSKSSVPAARNIKTEGHKADQTDASNVKAAVDAALVIKASIPTAPVTPEQNKFAKFEDVTHYLVPNTYLIGGSNPQFWKLQFRHTPKYAVAQYCEAAPQPAGRPAAIAPLSPRCATDSAEDVAGLGHQPVEGYLVLRYDLGSLRVPPFVIFVTSLALFLLGLLCLHWRERDEQEAAAAEAQKESAKPTPVPAKV